MISKKSSYFAHCDIIRVNTVSQIDYTLEILNVAVMLGGGIHVHMMKGIILLHTEFEGSTSSILLVNS